MACSADAKAQGRIAPALASMCAQPRGELKATLVGALVEALRQGKVRRGVGRGVGWDVERKPGGGSAIVPDSLKIINDLLRSTPA